MNYTKEQFAQLLDGREYGDEILKHEKQWAKESGLVVVFGYSDDNVEFKGAIDDEIGAYEGGELEFTKDGIFYDEDDEETLTKYKSVVVFNKIEAEWCMLGDFSWSFKTEIPHSTFDILEEGEPFCKGIVFSIADLK